MFKSNGKTTKFKVLKVLTSLLDYDDNLMVSEAMAK